jgi:hypothetical protein
MVNDSSRQQVFETVDRRGSWCDDVVASPEWDGSCIRIGWVMDCSGVADGDGIGGGSSSGAVSQSSEYSSCGLSL